MIFLPRKMKSIRAKLNLIIITVSFITIISFAAVTFFVVYKIVRQQMLDDARALAGMVAYNSRAALIFKDRKGLDKVLASLGTNQEILHAVVYDSSGVPFAVFSGRDAEQKVGKWQSGPFAGLMGHSHWFSKDRLIVIEPILMEQKQIGTIRLEISLDHLIQSLNWVLGAVGAAVICACLFALILSEFMQKIISAPIRDMADVMLKVSKDRDYSRRVRKSSDDEIGLLAESFNEMLREVEARDTHLEEMVSERTEALTAAVDEAYRLANEAEKASRAKSRFLASMSHELRTPLNAVIGMAQLALDSALTPRQARYIQSVQSAGNTLLAIINDILDFSKIESGELNLDVHPFNILELCEEVSVMVAQAVPDKDIDIICHVGHDVPEHLTGDSYKIRQVLLNLLGNAAKFTEKGWAVLSCSLSQQDKIEGNESDLQNVKLLFQVVDTGIGLRREQIESVFDAFSQADSSMTRKYGGTGLGLSISSRLVEFMGGKIEVESEYGKGTVFSFELALDIDAAAVSHASDAVMERLKEIAENTVITVADSNPWGRKAIVDMVRAAGFRVIEADTLERLSKVTAMFRETDNQLIIMHEAMAGGEMQALFDRDASGSIPENVKIIMVSRSPSDMVQCQGRGDFVACCLTQPVTRNNLFESMIYAATGLSAYETVMEVKKEIKTEPVSAHKADAADILLVEDTVMNQELVRNIMEKQGHRLVVASDGGEALNILAGQDFDLILMDVQMPGMDGITATRIIRAMENGSPVDDILEKGLQRILSGRLKGRHIPVIAMTAHAFSEDRDRCLQAGMDGYLSKPFRIEDIVRVLREYLPDKKGAATVSDDDSGRDSHAHDDSDTREVNKNAVRKYIASEFGLPDDKVEEIMKAAARSLRENLDRAAKALDDQDYETLFRAAHTLKGSLGNLNLNELAAKALEMEMHARKEQDYDYVQGIEELRAALEPLIK